MVQECMTNNVKSFIAVCRQEFYLEVVSLDM